VLCHISIALLPHTFCCTVASRSRIAVLSEEHWNESRMQCGPVLHNNAIIVTRLRVLPCAHKMLSMLAAAASHCEVVCVP
jgi:hypothetical protein